MSLIRKFTNTGVNHAKTKSEKRNVVLGNYVCLIAATANMLLALGRFYYGATSVMAVQTLIPGTLLFLVPVILNRYGFLRVSRLLLCWAPPAFVMYGTVLIMNATSTFESSSYVGIRYTMLATSSIPLIVNDLRDKPALLAALAGPIVLLLGFDPILSFFDLGYNQVGLNETTYYFNNIRAVVSLMIIISGFVMLKILIEKNDALNEDLIEQLGRSNKLIQQQAETEVNKLNGQLKRRLRELTEREFILSESQRVAKIGSWEYRLKDGRVVWSDEMYNIFGLDKSAAINLDSMTSSLIAEHRDLMNGAIAEVIKKQKSVDFTLQAKTPLGKHKWLRIYIYAAEEAKGVRGICHDVTSYKEAEEQMKMSEAKYKALFEQATDGIMITDFQGRFREVNNTLVQMLGFSKGELLQRHIDDLMEPDELSRNPLRYAQLLMGEQVINERSLLHKNGSIVNVEASVKRFGDESIMAIARDTTELKKAQHEIKISEARFRGAFEESAIGMTLVSMDGGWLKVNRAFSAITGYTEEELLAMNFQEMTHPDDLPEDMKIMEAYERGSSETMRRQKRFIHKTGRTIWVNMNVSLIRDNKGRPVYFVCQVEDITELIRTEREKEHARHALNERIKELTTLYQTSRLLNDDQKPLAVAMQDIVSLLPSGWQYPTSAAARIVIDESEFKTPNYRASIDKQEAHFQTPFGAKGIVEVVYLERRPMEVEGPFLAEERSLINMIADMIRVYLIRRHEADALSKSEANLSATINNSETLIWSVDPDYALLTFNEPFARHVKKYYGIQVAVGVGMNTVRVPSSNESVWKETTEKWRKIYQQVFAGKRVVVEMPTFDRILHYALMPILINGRIIGVSVFANDVTVERQREADLAEATKKIGELKLMALRSVMSPHFIFNVLNSIQFFIARNERENAINYLSMFSKLIRNVLTHSVDNKIKLSDEIELLRNYVMLEMTRFENKFNFVLNVDPSLDIDAVEIPSLLIQPYVENAILHGLYNKTTAGTLCIDIHDEAEGFVVFEVMDDGIGRQAASAIREKNLIGHKSMGANLTEERLKLIAQTTDTLVHFDDLDSNGMPAGTRVRIRIKL
jgi:PAS domain S-box-containing protein